MKKFMTTTALILGLTTPSFAAVEKQPVQADGYQTTTMSGEDAICLDGDAVTGWEQFFIVANLQWTGFSIELEEPSPPDELGRVFTIVALGYLPADDPNDRPIIEVLAAYTPTTNEVCVIALMQYIGEAG